MRKAPKRSGNRAREAWYPASVRLRSALPFAFLFLCICALNGRAQTLEVGAERHTDAQSSTRTAVAADKEVEASFRARLTQAGASANKGGRLEFVFSAFLQAPVPVTVSIHVPLASETEAYGESRSCRWDHDQLRVTFTAGLDEKNFVAFKTAAQEREFRFLLNKYLCRVLAAPLQCGGREVTLSKDVAKWRLGGETQLVLASRGAPARAETSAVELWRGGKPFDYAQCEKIAPSNGLCCVGGKTTEWHCGSSPAGEGWRQVSGSCFHRETGGSCKE